ncbi:MAG: teichoic acid transporter [Rubrivivax sp.]|nr:teichoic acid transporter [Rubrivivax sp.]
MPPGENPRSVGKVAMAGGQPGNSLRRGAAAHVLSRAVTMALALGLLVVVARLGPAVQGAFALFVALESLLVTAGSGLALVLAREASAAGGRPPGLLHPVLRGALLLGAVCGLVFVAWASASHAAPYSQLWLLGIAAPLLLVAPTVAGSWLGQGRVWALNAPAIAAPALVLTLVAGLALADEATPGVTAVLAAWVLGKAAVGLLTGVVAMREGPAVAAPPPATPWWRRHARFMALVALTNAVSLLNLRATLFLVERNHGLAAAGVYAVAVQIAELLWVLSGALTVAAYHRIAGDDEPAAARMALRALRTGLALALLAAPLLALAGWWLLPVVLGPAYAAARVPLLLLLPGVALYAAASSLSAFHTNFHGRPQWAAGIAGLSLAVTLALAAVLVPRLGAAGAAMATSTGYTVAIVFALRGFLQRAGGWAALWGGAAAKRQSG